MRLSGAGESLRLEAFLLSGDIAAEAWIKPLLQEERPAAAYGRSLLAGGAKAPVPSAAARPPGLQLLRRQRERDRRLPRAHAGPVRRGPARAAGRAEVRHQLRFVPARSAAHGAGRADGRCTRNPWENHHDHCRPHGAAGQRGAPDSASRRRRPGRPRAADDQGRARDPPGDRAAGRRPGRRRRAPLRAAFGAHRPGRQARRLREHAAGVHRTAHGGRSAARRARRAAQGRRPVPVRPRRRGGDAPARARPRRGGRQRHHRRAGRRDGDRRAAHPPRPCPRRHVPDRPRPARPQRPATTERPVPPRRRCTGRPSPRRLAKA